MEEENVGDHSPNIDDNKEQPPETATNVPATESDVKKAASDVKETIRHDTASASEAKVSASDTKETMSDAKTSGSDTKASASDAKTTGSDAKVTGSNVKVTAPDAKSTASDVKATASDAKATTPDAKTTASDVKATASDAKATASDAKTVASDTKATAPDAKATASDDKAIDSHDIITASKRTQSNDKPADAIKTQSHEPIIDFGDTRNTGFSGETDDLEDAEGEDDEETESEDYDGEIEEGEMAEGALSLRGDEEEIGEEEEKPLGALSSRIKFGPAEVKEVELDDMFGDKEDVIEFDEDDKKPAETESELKMRPQISDFDFVLSEESLEMEEEVSEESEPPPLDREPYFEMYLKTMQTYGIVKRLNSFLHKKMADYFKKRKMLHVINETTDGLDDMKVKYGKKLNQYSELLERDAAEKRIITEKVTELKTLAKFHKNKANKCFQDLMSREREVGIGLINAKTGKEIPDKLVDRLIENQRSKARELQELRLINIKIRNAVVEKTAAIKSLDTIGDNYTLMEYEQLKIENQSHSDKIEERDGDLAKLRKICSGAIQCLAHVREKCSAVEINIKFMKDKLFEKETEKTEVRERMNQLKQERDYYRQETQRLKEENGLLTKDKLLIDMDDSMKLTTKLEEVIQRKQELYEKKKKQLVSIRRNYEKEKQKKRYEHASKVEAGSPRLTISGMDENFRFFQKK